MKCADTLLALTELHEGLLNAHRAREFEQHLAICASCRQQRLDTDSLRDRLQAGYDEPVGAGESVTDTVMARIRDARTRGGPPVDRERAPTPRVTPWWRLGVVAAAAVVLVAVWGIADRASGAVLTLADLSRALDEREWVHVEFDDGREEWANLRAGRFYYRDGRRQRYVLVDRAQNARWMWNTGQQSIVRDRPMTYPDGVVPPWEPPSAWSYVAGNFEQWLEAPRPGIEVERQEVEDDGMALVRFDLHRRDAAGEFFLQEQLWADPATRLPVRKRRRLTVAESQRVGVEWIVGNYDFPNQGPESLQDLGVPQGLDVVDIEPESAPVEAQQRLQSVQAAAAAFPPRWRHVTWSAQEQDVYVIHWSGPAMDWRSALTLRPGTLRLRVDRYHDTDFKLLTATDEQRAARLERTTADVLAWAADQQPVSIQLADGHRAFRASCPWPWESADQGAVRVTTAIGFSSNHWPQSLFWPLADRGGTFSLESPAVGAPSLTELLRCQFGDQRTDSYVAVLQDFLCLKRELQERQGEVWTTTRTEELRDLTQLPGGQWVAGRRVFRDDEGTVREWTLRFDVLSDGEFPDGVFDGDALLALAEERGWEVSFR